jgi:hypothetical protein
LLRTDFSYASAWNAICKEIQKPSVEGFKANVEFIDDRSFEDITVQQLLDAVPPNYPHSFIIVADRASIGAEDRTLLIVNLYEDGLARTFAQSWPRCGQSKTTWSLQIWISQTSRARPTVTAYFEVFSSRRPEVTHDHPLLLSGPRRDQSIRLAIPQHP